MRTSQLPAEQSLVAIAFARVARGSGGGVPVVGDGGRAVEAAPSSFPARLADAAGSLHANHAAAGATTTHLPCCNKDKSCTGFDNTHIQGYHRALAIGSTELDVHLAKPSGAVLVSVFVSGIAVHRLCAGPGNTA